MQYYIRENIQKSISVQEIVKHHQGFLLQKEICFLSDQFGSEVNTIEKKYIVFHGKVNIVNEEEMEQAIEDLKKDVDLAHYESPVRNTKVKAF